jgi:hypothetical protein
MAFTMQDVCDLARTWLNDDSKTRHTDLKLEMWGNSCIQAMSLLAPHLFASVGTVTPTPGQCVQDLRTANDKALVLYNVLTNVAGEAVYECDFYQMVSFTPAAMTQATGVPVNWAREPSDQDKQSGTRYYLFPPPANGTSLLVESASTPDYIVLASNVPVSQAYRPAIANYIVYCAESVDDEHVTTQRAVQSLQAFMTLIGAGVQTKQVAPEGTA